MAVWTQEQYQNLCNAIAEGAMEVKYGDKWIKYNSLSDMLKLKSVMEQDLGITKNPSGNSYAWFDKGL